MAILKCKMCGGQLDIIDDETVVTCEYCGSKQTVPTVDDDKKMKLFERANKLRFNCDFDKAASVYENIISDFSDEAEAYWGLILCTYGIEYVDDPATGKKIPTCHRSSFDSVMDDPNFEMVMENADSIALPLYREQAKEIEEIRKGIIEVSGKEEPYDIFICYKETDEKGERTLDSVLAQDVYDVLTDKGYRVFFSRITLEDKLGVEYEPYIFAALNSAKVMLAFGTSYQYYNAVWVKNEWSRFLKLMAKDKSKHLIPCFKNLDAYDMPKEFAKLQAQDLGKVGAVQDLIRGIEKLIPLGKTEEVKETVMIQQAGGNPTSESLLKRVFMFLEDKEWNSANEYCEKVLDFDPENAQAYLGKLMAELQISKQESLKDHKLPFDEKNNYKKALRFGSEQLKTLLEDSIRYINERNENERKEGIYIEANQLMSDQTTYSYEKAANLFESISDYKDSKEFERKCHEEIDKINTKKTRLKHLMGELDRMAELEETSMYERQLIQKKHNKFIEKKAYLEQLLNDFDGITSEIQNLKQLNENLNAKIDALKLKKESLGIFSGKQKKQIEQDIFTIKNNIKDNQDKIDLLEKQCDGYRSKEEIRTEITENLHAISDLDDKSNNQHLNQLSIQEIIQELEGTKEGRESVESFRKRQKMSEQRIHMLINLKQECKVGEIISLGMHNDKFIEWKVLSVRDGKALLITNEIVGFIQFNKELKDTTWETCTLHDWLNNVFVNQIFNKMERDNILKTTVQPHKNPEYDTNQGNATQDKMFLLSIKEVNQYFNNNNDRCCKLSEAFQYNGTYVNNNENYSWWLRSVGSTQNRVAIVDSIGNVSEHGRSINTVNNGVRPAMWIDLSK